MKLLILLILFPFTATARIFYFSSTTGSDGYTAKEAQNNATPWASISKMNGFTFSENDTILFKRGDTFYGTIEPLTSNLTYGAYGMGTNPIITGLTSVSSWTKLGNNIWEATVPGGLSTLNTVVIRGKLIPMGRYPNAGTANAGYLTYTSWVNNRSVTNAALTGTPNYTGGQVVVREQGYTTDRATITSQTGSTLNYSSLAKETMREGFGFFIQNHPSTLDVQNEWYYYDASGIKKIQIYSPDNPGTIRVATLASLVNMNYGTSKSKITFSNIDFTGSEASIVKMVNASGVTFEACNFSFGGVSGIEYGQSSYLTVKNCHFADINMCGIYEIYYRGVTNTLIENNVLQRIGINPGMIAFTSPEYTEGNSSTGIAGGSDNLTIISNILDSIGYNAITLRQNRNNILVRKNIISNWCMVKNDGGGIYNVGQRGLPPANDVVIDSNIVSKSVGEVGGTPFGKDIHVKGIYLDATSQAIKVLHNTVFNSYIGISISHAQNNVIKGNTVFNCGIYNPGGNNYGGQLSIDDGLSGFTHCSGNVITDNIFFAARKDQLLYMHNDNFHRIDSIGIVDSNSYIMPFGDYPTHVLNQNSVISVYSLKYWKAKHPVYEKNSKLTPLKIAELSYNTARPEQAANKFFDADITGMLASSSPAVHTLSWDNTNQITGKGSAKVTSDVAGGNFTSLYQVIGPIDAGKSYVLRFKTKGTRVGLFKAYLQQWTGRYNIITSKVVGTVDTTIQQHEIVFSGEHSTEASAAVFIQFSQDKSTVYVDDVEFFEASIVRNKMPSNIRFEYNATDAAKTVTLDAKYTGVDGVSYNDKIIIPRYSSKILIKNTGLPLLTND